MKKKKKKKQINKQNKIINKNTKTNPPNPDTEQAATNNTKLRETLARVRKFGDIEAEESETRKNQTRLRKSSKG